MRFLLRLSIYIAALATLTIIFCNAWVISTTSELMISDLADEQTIPKVALVLGTSKSQVGGGDNLFFTSRMDAAKVLYESGKIKHFILSGDNETVYYNEPKDMQKALLKKGIPNEVITLDYAGVRTLDSIIRCNQVFGQDHFIIVTQEFHAYRAAFIAKFYGLDVKVFVAKDPDYDDITKVLLREILARTYAVFDLYFFNTQPKYQDKQVKINVD
jgi:SanA protein